MIRPKSLLHLLCGKIASGKSTLAAHIGASQGAVVISEDQLLADLFRDQISSLPSYVQCQTKLRLALAPHIAALLDAGQSVVLDFHANTRQSRAWMRTILDQTMADHRLHLLDVPDAVCLARLRSRNASGAHPFPVTEDDFWQITAHFAPPTQDEGFDIQRYDNP